MKLGLAVVGALSGMLVAGGGDILLGALAGAGVGFLVGHVRQLNERLERLESQEWRRPAAATVPSQERAEPEPPAGPQPPVETTEVESPRADYGTRGEAAPPPLPVEMPAEPAAAADVAPEPTAVERFLAAAREWLTTGNVPVKLGVVVSFFGVGFLLKYSIDRKILVVPIEARLLLVAAAAIGLLVLGWRLRESSRVYGLSLQGGGIGILYLTIFAAFRLYGLLPALLAFLLLVALTAFAGLIAVLQDSRVLAVLGTVGGFLAPVLVSTDSGNHVALFSYYLILNLAILGIARFRTWRELNLLGFFFTFVIGTLWGRENYRPELFASTEPFLIAHFLLYQAVAVMFALRQPTRLKGLVDGTLVFGAPVAAFALQSVLVADTEYGLAISAIVVAVFYIVLTRWLWRNHRDSLRTITESYLALAVAFATLAIPLALDARWTAASWALEGVALVWVGTRQSRVLAKFAGTALLVLAGGSFAIDGWHSGEGIPILNGNLLGGLLVGASSLLASRLLSAEQKPHPLQRAGGVLLFIWGAGWWLGSGAREIEDSVTGILENHLLTLWISVSCLASTVLGRWRDWPAARVAALAHLPLLAIAALLYSLANREPFAHWGVLFWVGAALVQTKILWDRESVGQADPARWHVGTVLSFVALLAWQTHWLIDRLLGPVWAGSAACLVLAVAVSVVLGAGSRIRWPIGRHRPAYLLAAGVLATAGLGAVWLLVAGSAGDPAPLPYIPVLNPFDLTTLVALLGALWWLVTARRGSHLDQAQWRLASIVWLVAAFVLTTTAVVRGVVQLSGLEWRPGEMIQLVTVQAALSIYWGLLGVAGMVLGARRRQRWTWLVGAGLMGLVVIKLFVVDLGNTETVARIISFIGVGALLLLVGYFAPAPPRQSDEENEA